MVQHVNDAMLRCLRDPDMGKDVLDTHTHTAEAEAIRIVAYSKIAVLIVSKALWGHATQGASHRAILTASQVMEDFPEGVSLPPKLSLALSKALAQAKASKGTEVALK